MWVSGHRLPFLTTPEHNTWHWRGGGSVPWKLNCKSCRTFINGPERGDPISREVACPVALGQSGSCGALSLVRLTVYTPNAS